MRRIASTTMTLEITARPWPRVLSLALLLAMGPAFAADAPASKSDATTANRAATSDRDAIVSTTPTEQEKSDFKERVKQQCEAMATKTGQDKKTFCQMSERRNAMRQSMRAICVATTKDCEKFECLGVCYEPYPTKPPARQAKK